MRILKLLIALAVVLAIGWLAASPYITLYQMKQAADARDGEALSEHVDFPSVRQSIKDQLNTRVARKMGTDSDDSGALAMIGASVAGVLVDRMVDAYVTPTGIAEVMEGNPPGPRLWHEGDDEDKTEGGGKAPADREALRDKAKLSYTSFSRFVVTVPDKSGAECQLVLRRRGLGWKLTEILLPEG